MKNKKKKIFGILLLILIFGTTVIFGVTNKQYAGDQGTIDIKESTIANNLVLDYIGQFIFAIGNIFQTVTGWIMQILTGNNIFPWADKVVFNTIPLLDVNFINPEVNSLFSIAEDSIGIGQVIRNIYFTGLSISLGFMGIIIAVMAIKLAISSIGSEKAKYKEAITTWATSLVLLFAMHYFIAFMFYMNEQLVIVASSILSNTIKYFVSRCKEMNIIMFYCHISIKCSDYFPNRTSSILPFFIFNSPLNAYCNFILFFI